MRELPASASEGQQRWRRCSPPQHCGTAPPAHARVQQLLRRPPNLSAPAASASLVSSTIHGSPAGGRSPHGACLGHSGHRSVPPLQHPAFITAMQLWHIRFRARFRHALFVSFAGRRRPPSRRRQRSPPWTRHRQQTIREAAQSRCLTRCRPSPAALRRPGSTLPLCTLVELLRPQGAAQSAWQNPDDGGWRGGVPCRCVGRVRDAGVAA